jgi:nitroreductase
MNVVEALKLRKSVRLYKDELISKENLEKIVDSARLAPSARGVWPWEFIVVTDKGILCKFSEIMENARFLAQAAACIVVFCSDTKYYLEDGCAATENILICAASLGIGSCWIAGDKKPYAKDVAKILSVPGDLKLVSIVSLGYAEKDDTADQRKRRGLSEVIHWNKF